MPESALTAPSVNFGATPSTSRSGKPIVKTGMPSWAERAVPSARKSGVAASARNSATSVASELRTTRAGIGCPPGNTTETAGASAIT